MVHLEYVLISYVYLKEVELFDAKQYLSNRSGDQFPTILSAEDLEAEEV